MSGQSDCTHSDEYGMAFVDNACVYCGEPPSAYVLSPYWVAMQARQAKLDAWLVTATLLDRIRLIVALAAAEAWGYEHGSRMF